MRSENATYQCNGVMRWRSARHVQTGRLNYSDAAERWTPSSLRIAQLHDSAELLHLQPHGLRRQLAHMLGLPRLEDIARVQQCRARVCKDLVARQAAKQLRTVHHRQLHSHVLCRIAERALGLTARGNFFHLLEEAAAPG